MYRPVHFLPAAMLVSATLLGGVAQAHARLVSATPAANSAAAAPTRIELHFSEAIASKFSHITLSAADGKPQSLAVATAADDKTLAASPATPLAAGSYTVSWVAVATDDGHKTAGKYRFAVK